MAGRLKPPGHGTLDFPNFEDVRIEGWRVAVSLNGNPLPRVDEAENGLRERQHCPWREEFFKLIAILPRQTFGEVFARIGRAAKRGCKYTDGSPTLQPPLVPSATSAGMAAAQLLLRKIQEVETRGDPDRGCTPAYCLLCPSETSKALRDLLNYSTASAVSRRRGELGRAAWYRAWRCRGNRSHPI